MSVAPGPMPMIPRPRRMSSKNCCIVSTILGVTAVLGGTLLCFYLAGAFDSESRNIDTCETAETHSGKAVAAPSSQCKVPGSLPANRASGKSLKTLKVGDFVWKVHGRGQWRVKYQAGTNPYKITKVISDKQYEGIYYRGSWCDPQENQQINREDVRTEAELAGNDAAEKARDPKRFAQTLRMRAKRPEEFESCIYHVQKQKRKLSHYRGKPGFKWVPRDW